MIKKNKKEYLVSWSPIADNCVYGKDEKDFDGNFKVSYTDPMTLKQAERRAKELYGSPVGVYKLVLVKKLKGQD